MVTYDVCCDIMMCAVTVLIVVLCLSIATAIFTGIICFFFDRKMAMRELRGKCRGKMCFSPERKFILDEAQRYFGDRKVFSMFQFDLMIKTDGEAKSENNERGESTHDTRKRRRKNEES